MTTLVVGASGATGQLLVEQLLERGESVRVIVRSADRLPAELKNRDRLTITVASLLNLSDVELAKQVEGCRAVASCLGHNMSFKGIYGQPRRLVTAATLRLYLAIRSHSPESPVRFVLMNTTGYRNRDLAEPISFAQKCVIGLLRLLLPPHADNEEAAELLRSLIGRNNAALEWVVVRPDSLTNEEQVTEYRVYPSPIRSAIFNAGKTSRMNVGHFMADLITNDDLWNQWKGQMPVIYNEAALVDDPVNIHRRP